jgi:brefeldin A-inhibited guanine nucleotide-exchange protein
MSIFERGKNEIKDANNLPYITVDDCGPIRPMFENTWSANLATLSMILEETTDEAMSNLCIEGFILSIKICGFFNMRTERDAFVSSFAKFTLVTSERRLKPKNLACIVSLMNLATYQGNYLGESWYFVLECVSKLEEMINMGSG